MKTRKITKPEPTNKKQAPSTQNFIDNLPKMQGDTQRFFGNLKVNGSQFEALFNIMPQGMALFSIIYGPNGEAKDFVTMEANKAYTEIVGLAKEQILFQPIAQNYLLHIMEPQSWLAVFDQVASSGNPAMFEAFFKEKCYQVYVYSMFKGFCVAVFIDITLQKTQAKEESAQRQQFQEALDEGSAKYQYLIKYAPTGIYEIDAHDRFRSVNEVMCKALGYSEKELLLMKPSSLLFPESRKRFKHRMRDVLAGKNVDETVEYHVKTKTGAGLWVVMQVRFTHRDSSVDGALVIVHDVTERKRSERALLSAERRYRRLYETTQDGIMARDLEGKMINCNPAYAKMLGYTRKELRSLPVTHLLPEKWHMQRERIAKKVIETGRSIVFEREYRRKDGSIFPASVRTWRLTDGKGKVIGIWSIVREISLQKQQQRSLEEHAGILERIVQDREKQLKDAERLVAIGQTAGMVGHDLRNPLQTLTGELYLAKTEVSSLPDGDAKINLEESIHVIEEQILYMDKIVSDLQAFVQPVHIDKKPIGLQELLSNALQTVSIPGNVAVRLQNDGGALQIRVDPQLLKRVLINLITNAVQAMPNGGKLNLMALVDSSEHVSITVEDTGVGIPDRIRHQIFTPLFTTKPRGQGFGLAVCKRVIEAHGGTISYESAEGKGTRFTIAFPSA